MAREPKGAEKKASPPAQASPAMASRPFSAAEGRVGPGSAGAREERSVKQREDDRSLETLQLFAEEEEEEELP